MAVCEQSLTRPVVDSSERVLRTELSAAVIDQADTGNVLPTANLGWVKFFGVLRTVFRR